MHHTQHITDAMGATDRQTGLAEHPLKYFAGTALTQGFQQCRQFD